MPRYRFMSYKTVSNEGDIDGPFSSLSYNLSGTTGDLAIVHPSGKVALTGDGGLACKMTNGCGRASATGWAVTAHTASNNSYHLSTSGYDIIGYVYESVPAGVEGWVVTNGICNVMIGGGIVTAGDILTGWSGSATDGVREGVLSASARTPAGPGNPFGLALGTLDKHFSEGAHCLETHASGSNYLVKACVHFN